MGTKTKLESNFALAKPHDAGAKIICLQTLTHSEYGAIGYSWPMFYEFDLHLADECFTDLKMIHDEVLKMAPDSSNMRIIYDHNFLIRIYSAGTRMVSHATRSVQHLAERMQGVSGVSLKSTTAEERIREAVALFGLSDHHEEDGYQGYLEILKMRDAVEHPKATNVYQGEPSKWDEVPLAWVLSDRSILAFTRFDSWFGKLTSQWREYEQNHSEQIELTVRRGIESKLSVKKSPGESGSR